MVLQQKIATKLATINTINKPEHNAIGQYQKM